MDVEKKAIQILLRQRNTIRYSGIDKSNEHRIFATFSMFIWNLLGLVKFFPKSHLSTNLITLNSLECWNFVRGPLSHLPVTIQ